METICKNCGKKIELKRKFCGGSCSIIFYNKNKKGTKRSKSSIEKQKESNKIFWNSKKGEKERNRRKKQAKHQSSQEKYKKIFVKSIENFRNNEEAFQKSLEKQKETIKKKVEEGTWNTFKTRNFKSYPELYTENFLLKHKINFIREKYINKRDLGLGEHGGYFLDFFFEEKNINLEIDGSQHLKRKESDKKRDLYLSKNGIIVIRINWVNIKNKKEREQFNNKLSEVIKIVTYGSIYNI